MTVYFQMTELADCGSYSVTGLQVRTTGINTSNVRSGIEIDEGADASSFISSPTFSATDLWVHFNHYVNVQNVSTTTSTKSMVRFMSGGTQRIRVNPVDANTVQIESWNGAAWTLLASGTATSIFATSQRHITDIHATIGAAATISVYIDGTLIATAENVDTTFGGTVTAFDTVIWGCPNIAGSGTGLIYSEMIGANWNTIGSKLVTRIPDANGNYAEWTNGDFTVVDDIPGNGGVDYATSGTADQRVDWSMSSFPELTGNLIVASTQINVMINRDTTGPQNANFFVRTGGTDYHSADQPLNITQSGLRQKYETDPSTSAAWDITNLNNTTFGIRSRT